MFPTFLLDAYTAALLGAGWFAALLTILSMTETAWFWTVRAALVAGGALASAAALSPASWW